jgi:hypothetical protein
VLNLFWANQLKALPVSLGAWKKLSLLPSFGIVSALKISSLMAVHGPLDVRGKEIIMTSNHQDRANSEMHERSLFEQFLTDSMDEARRLSAEVRAIVHRLGERSVFIPFYAVPRQATASRRRPPCN